MMGKILISRFQCPFKSQSKVLKKKLATQETKSASNAKEQKRHLDLKAVSAILAKEKESKLIRSFTRKKYVELAVGKGFSSRILASKSLL